MSSPIRVAYLINSLGAGGAERFLCDLAAHLDPDRVHAEVFCLYTRGQFAPEMKAANVPVHLIGVKRSVVPGNWVQVWRQLGAVDADIVHTHLHEAAWYGLPGAFLRRTPVRISHLQGAHWYWPRKLRWLDRAAETFASTSLACSADVERFAREGLRYPARKLQVVPNATNLDRFRSLPTRADARRSLDLPQDAPILICVASLIEHKGQAYLIEAMRTVRSELPEARLLLAGRDRSQTDLPALAERHGVADCVSFLGSRDDVAMLLAASDLSVLPSLREGFPLSLLETAAAGLPTVASSVGGIPETVEDGVAGLLVPPRDPAALAEAILTVLRDPIKLEAMGEAARKRAAREFDIRVVARRIEDLYTSMLAARRGKVATVPG
jgi:glycosyltransferase involved in cell wall biosynthesis